jgi:hypothetical protein
VLWKRGTGDLGWECQRQGGRESRRGLKPGLPDILSIRILERKRGSMLQYCIRGSLGDT